MSKLIIDGGNRLCGSVNVQGAKNSILSLICASVLYDGKVYIKNCNKLTDITTMCEIVSKLGGKYSFLDNVLCLDCSSLYSFNLDSELSKKVRSSFFLAGALLSRFKRAEVFLPGGCKIGGRPVDVHIDGFKQLGVKVEEKEDKYLLSCDKIYGNVVKLSMPSVGATENLIMASVFCDGQVVIKNAAKEPEIVDLQNLLNSFGFDVKGAGTSEIVINGVEKVGKESVIFIPIGDRIEAGTYLLSACSTFGEIEVNGICYKNILPLLQKFRKNHCKMYISNDKIYINYNTRAKGLDVIETGPYPGFPTDLQAPLTAFACKCNGKTIIRERVFENRFAHALELNKMGANIIVSKDEMQIMGVKDLYGSNVSATDLRAGACLVIAGLSAIGKTVIDNVELIDRGYYKIEKVLSSLGAKIKRKN